jgi:hypothetical protein
VKRRALSSKALWRMRHAEERYAFILSRLLQSNSTP